MPVLYLMSVALLINIGEWLYLWFKIPRTSGTIFLHYNIFFGIDLIGSWYQIYIMPLSALSIILINFYISLKFFPSNKKFSIMILSFSFFLVMLAGLAILLIVRQNI